MSQSIPDHDYPTVLDQIRTEIQPLLGQGRVASYIPELAKVRGDQFGMAVVTLNGQVSACGDARVPFSIQSVSKLFALTLAYQCVGDALWQRVGREPSGNPFNSLVQLESEQGKPRNPFINAGALVVTDVLCTRFVNPETALVEFVRRLSGNATLQYDDRVARSEMATAERNRAMGHFMRSFGNLHNPVDEVIAAYCRHCAIRMDAVDLARAVAFLAHGGVNPWNGERVVSASTAKRLSALMLTCGTYDAAGDFAFRVGIPAKSGVGGGIVGHIPGQLGVCVWSPELEPSGNSLAGSYALERFTTLTGQSLF
ncbi:glutaminase [Ideonella dechloratans]|uniref:Glutaminase n=1 Tax=Ideonella dechloratans TaxID=36863 RepID=A0A643FCQ9_IDEDE|nr:glutaminase [Ideonella dechloratans]KAB0582545.1 glutaminase [Ideonella dechloratans]UFU11450.1 glutaminase [Ideonella dechloratans]